MFTDALVMASFGFVYRSPEAAIQSQWGWRPKPRFLGDEYEQRYRFEFQSDGKRTADN